MKENSLKNCPLSPKDPEYSQLLLSFKGIHRWKAMDMHLFAEQLTLLDVQMFRLIQAKDVIAGESLLQQPMEKQQESAMKPPDFTANDFFLRNLPWIVLIVLWAGTSFVLWVRSAHGRAVIDRASLRVPVFGVLLQRAAVARLCRSLAILCRRHWRLPWVLPAARPKTPIGLAMAASASRTSTCIRSRPWRAARSPCKPVCPPAARPWTRTSGSSTPQGRN